MTHDRDTAGRLPVPAQRPAAERAYLSCDDGPDPRWTPRILDLLAQANVPATFFVVGRQVLPDFLVDLGRRGLEPALLRGAAERHAARR